MRSVTGACGLLLCSALITTPVLAQHFPKEDDEKTVDQALGKAPYSPYAERKYPSHPFFGDTHLHTGMSMDAGVWGKKGGILLFGITVSKI